MGGRRRRWTTQWASQCCGGGDGRGDARPACGAAPEMRRSPAAAVEPAATAAAQALARSEENGTADKIESPDDPFVDGRPVSLHVGTTVIVDAYVKPNAMRFIVDLISGPARAPDIAFHLNPRLQQRVVVRNSRIRGHWGAEQCAAIGNFPFGRDENISIQLLCAEEEFMVAFNGKHFCTFMYRVPLTQICLIKLSGDLIFKSLECESSDTYPIIKEAEMEKFVFALKESLPLSSILKDVTITTPLTLSLPCNFSEGKEIEVTGTVKLLPYVFYINLQQGSQTWPCPEIPLHINPRFGEKGPIIVCNAWSNGKWGLEERGEVNNLLPAHEFTLQIVCDVDHYSVVVNRTTVSTFKHRIPYKIVNCIIIYGDVWIKDVNFR